jgi:uncharacterized protein YndB with AHSA1/START domain
VHAEPLTACVHVEAEPDAVYDYFTQAEAMVSWMGDYAFVDAQPGGEFSIDVNQAQIRGRYQELDPPHRLLISWGFAGSDELPPGASTVEVRLTKVAGGTRVEITHRGLPETQTDKHDHGWHHFLPRLAQAVAADTRRLLTERR